jgi:hypothetical protein
MTTYNGWTNYETWRVNLECFDGLDGYHDADTLKDIAEDIYFNNVDNGLAEGVISAFLSEVNWDEIAESLAEVA